MILYTVYGCTRTNSRSVELKSRFDHRFRCGVINIGSAIDSHLQSKQVISQNDKHKWISKITSEKQGQKNRMDSTDGSEREWRKEDILLQTAGLRCFPVTILNEADRETQPYKTISATIWLWGDVLAVSLKTPPPPSHSLSLHQGPSHLLFQWFF